MIAGKWQQREAFDGTYTFDDLLDAQEIIEVGRENERRTHEYWKNRKG